MKTNTFSTKRALLAVLVALMMAVSAYVCNAPKQASAVTFTLGGYTFQNPFGFDVSNQYVQSGSKIASKNGGGWQTYLVTQLETGTQNYYYKLTFNSNKGVTAGNQTEAIRFGICLYYSAAAIQDCNKNHLSVAMQWNYDENAPTRVKLHDIVFCDTFITQGSIWTDNWQTYETGTPADYVPTDNITVEVYKFHGSSTDEYGIKVGGKVYTYTLAASASDSTTNHNVGFYLFHENPASGAATMTVSDFVTCKDSSYKTDPTIEMNGSLVKSGSVGTKIKVPSATVKGAFNKTATLEPTVKLGSKTIKLTSRAFTPTEAGEYTITWSGKDPWGVTATPLEKKLTVTAEDEDEKTEDEDEDEEEGGAGMNCSMNAASEIGGMFSIMLMLSGVAFVLKARKHE